MIHEFIATGFYIGKLRLVPGTLGTLLGIPIVYLASFNRWTILLALGVVFLIGLITSQEVIAASGEEDPEEVVIDEVAGYIACFLFIEPTLKSYLLALGLFRVIDIFKPFPVNLLERLPGAYGVMLDDVAAGVMTSLLLFLLLK